MTKLGSPIDACAMTSKVRFSRSYATCSASAAPAPSECTLIWVQCQHTLIYDLIASETGLLRLPAKKSYSLLIVDIQICIG